MYLLEMGTLVKEKIFKQILTLANEYNKYRVCVGRKFNNYNTEITKLSAGYLK